MLFEKLFKREFRIIDDKICDFDKRLNQIYFAMQIFQDYSDPYAFVRPESKRLLLVEDKINLILEYLKLEVKDHPEICVVSKPKKKGN